MKSKLLSLLSLLPLLSYATPANSDTSQWVRGRTVDFTWILPAGVEYTFGPTEAYFWFSWPQGSPTYSPDRLAPAWNDLNSDTPPPNTIARVQAFENSVRIYTTGLEIWWKPDTSRDDIVRKKCTLYFDDDPGKDIIWDIAKATALAKDGSEDQHVKDVTHFDCVDDPE